MRSRMSRHLTSLREVSETAPVGRPTRAAAALAGGATGTAVAGEQAPGPGLGGAEATAAGQARLSDAEVLAAGRQETILSVERFGRYSVRASSRQGTAVRVIDRMAGELGAAGEAGHENGRLDLFLDRGDYQVVTESHVHGEGTAKLSVEPFRDGRDSRGTPASVASAASAAHAPAAPELVERKLVVESPERAPEGPDAAAEFRALRSDLAFQKLLGAAPAAKTARAGVAPALEVAAAVPAHAPFELPPEFTWHDYTVFLLHSGAEIEHALMVQYLYAAWSLGGPQVPAADRQRVAGWQTVILGIAKEEMGHLITVENLLRFIGGPLCFEREDYPFPSEFYPFNFTLERLTLDSLAKYVVAESPDDWHGPEADEIKRRAERANRGVITPVGKLYGRLIELFETTDPAYLEERDLQPRSLAFQASWDEWGRGYRDGQRGRSGPEHHSPDLLILTAASRDQAVAGLRAVAEQGEALVHEKDREESHFERFRRIYREMREVTWEPARPVALNPKPAGESDPDGEADAAGDSDLFCDVITDPEAIFWAYLFNVRYRLLLVNLIHALGVSGPTLQGEDLTPRGRLVNWTFAEMYNLRAIAGILMQRPLEQGGDPTQKAAGPPFEMPYTLELPAAEGNRWRLHRDLLEASGDEIDTLRAIGTRHVDFLRALADADRLTLEQVELLIPGP